MFNRITAKKAYKTFHCNAFFEKTETLFIYQQCLKKLQNVRTCSPSAKLFSYDCGSAPWLSLDGRSVSVLCPRQMSSRDCEASSTYANRKASHLSSASLNMQQHQNVVDNSSLNRWVIAADWIWLLEISIIIFATDDARNRGILEWGRSPKTGRYLIEKSPKICTYRKITQDRWQITYRNICYEMYL